MSKLLELKKAYGEAVDKMDEHAEAGGTEFEAAKAETDRLSAAIKRMEEAATAKAASAKPADLGRDGTAAGLPQSVPASAKDPAVKGQRLSRAIISLIKAQGNTRYAAEIAGELYGPEGEPVAKALAASVGQSGGFTVPEDFRAELIELLRPASVVYASGPRILDMPNGNLTIPGVATGAQAAYVGENQNITKTEQTFNQITLSAKKLAALVPISNDMLRYPSLSTEAFVRDDLVAALAQRGDLALIRGDGLIFGPRGLRSWAQQAGGVNFRNANTTVNVVNVTSDLANAELALMEANSPMRKMGWLMSPRTRTYLANVRDPNNNFVFPEVSQSNTLRGYPLRTTTQIPNNIGGTSTGSEIYFVDFNEFIVGEAISLEIVVVPNGTYFDGTQIISGLSQDQTVIRALTAHDAAMRQPKSVAVINDVRWAP